MRAVLFQMTEEEPDDGALKAAGAILKRGGLVAFPTETVYGLGGNAFDPSASEKIYAAKGRPSDNPLIVHICRFEDIYRIASEVPEEARILAEALWPGPLTMILKKVAGLPDATTGGLPTVAVRMPANKAALKLIGYAGGFVAAPSANLSGKPSPTCAGHVIADLGERIDAVIDAGPCRIGLESTIVDLTGERPEILRPGFYGRGDIEKLIGCVGTPLVKEEDRPRAPGMKYRHYAPAAKLFVVDGEAEKVSREIKKRAEEDALYGRNVGIICASENAEKYSGAKIYTLGSLTNDEEIAAALFSTLRLVDEDKLDIVYSESFRTERLGEAIMNRLIKAASGREILV